MISTIAIASSSIVTVVGDRHRRVRSAAAGAGAGNPVPKPALITFCVPVRRAGRGVRIKNPKIAAAPMLFMVLFLLVPSLSSSVVLVPVGARSVAIGAARLYRKA